MEKILKKILKPLKTDLEKLFIISNESIFENNGSFFCDNLDMKSTPEGLSQKYKISIIARKSKKVRAVDDKTNAMIDMLQG